MKNKPDVISILAGINDVRRGVGLPFGMATVVGHELIAEKRLDTVMG